MTALDPASHSASARIDSEGQLISADPRLTDLNTRAGGSIGAPLAVPEIAGLARLAGRLGIPIARALVIADGEDDVDLWVRAEPDADGVRLTTNGWRTREGMRPIAEPEVRAAAFAAIDADWHWETDAALRLTRLSVDAAAMLGISPASVLGQPLTRLMTLVEDDGVLPMLDAAAGRAAFRDQRAELRGSGRAIRISAAPRADAAGRFAGFVGSARFEVSSGTAAPAPVEEPVLSSDFGVHLGSALRAPLGRIIANAASLSAQVNGPLAPDYAGYANDIASAGRHLLGLVDDLADLAAVDRDDFRTAEEPIDLADIARRAAGLLAVRAAEGEVRIDKPGIDEVLPATGEFRRALQVLVNLIANAVRYSPAGAVVWVRAEREGDVVAVIVADQGRGIAVADQARIFDKFTRVEPGEPGGSGLGLYISRRLARAMGGDVVVDSAPGQGARFVFTLPAR